MARTAAQNVEDVRIQGTTDYDMFTVIVGNRPINQRHKEHLKESISQFNLLHVNPIIVNKKHEVIDGQHRLAAAKELGVTVYYVIVPDAALKAVQLLNALNRPWKNIDFVKSYAIQGIEDYTTLLTFMEQWELPPSTASSLLSGEFKEVRGHIISLQTGAFRIKDLQQATEYAKRLWEIRPYCDPFMWRSAPFIRALYFLYLSVPHEEFIERLREFPTKVRREVTTSLYLSQFEVILNYNRKITDSVRLQRPEKLLVHKHRE